jgi:phage replication initiation protein
VTRPSVSALVLDGSEVKLRLEAERIASGSAVHVDWVRFTVIRRNSPHVSPDVLFPVHPGGSVWDEDYRANQLAANLAMLPDCDFDAAAQALELAQEVAGVLGDGFAVAADVRKGHDFYRCRWAIERNGSECGWVGFLASGDSPRQQAQSRTIHCNLFGAACTFAAPGWNLCLADLVEERRGDLTRCDLALDFFDGFRGGLDRVMQDYKSGLIDSGGKRLKSNCVGDWANGHERSFYVGSKEAGKQTNVYEKGDQLFGVESASPWLRIELRYGNKLRILSVAMLRRPADFFAGASGWHLVMLLEAKATAVPEVVKTASRRALETVEAEVTRNLRWHIKTAAPTVAAAVKFLGVDALWSFLGNAKLPKRLEKFNVSELERAFSAAMDRFPTGESAGPAFASL